MKVALMLCYKIAFRVLLVSNKILLSECGAVLLTCNCLLCNQVRHQVVVKVDGTINVDSNSEASLLSNVAQENRCTVLL